jgi:uncharacterized protein YbaP (TraB family)
VIANDQNCETAGALEQRGWVGNPKSEIRNPKLFLGTLGEVGGSMTRRFTTFALTLVLTASIGTAAEKEGTVFMWKAQKDGAAVYLLGSVHALKEDSYPLPAVIEAAFDQSAVVVFEIDLDGMTDAALQMMNMGSLAEGQTLEETIGPGLWSAFSEKVSASGMPPSMFQFMKPWMAALTLASLELERAGYSNASGIDTHFSDRAKEAGKERMALETVDFQVGLFADLTPEESLAFLEYTVKDLETMIPVLDELAAKWRVGDAGYVQTMMGEEFEDYPDLYEKIIINRNRNWMPAIEGLLAGNRNAMVVVGGMHLVGKDGIIEMLRQKGYTVTQQ